MGIEIRLLQERAMRRSTTRNIRVIAALLGVIVVAEYVGLRNLIPNTSP